MTWMVHSIHPWKLRLAIIGTFLLTSAAACAPTPTPPKIFTVGVLNDPPATEAVYNGFRAEMEALGYAEGQTIQYIYHGPAGPDNLRREALVLMQANIDLMLALAAPSADVAMEVTAETDVPVIFWVIRDPVEAGYAQDLQRPGGNMTGITIGIEGTPTEGRRLEWLKRIAPAIERIYVPHSPDDRLDAQSLTTVRDAAEELDIELLLREVTTEEEALAAIESIPEGADAIFPIAGLGQPLFARLYPQIGELALQLRLPFSAPIRTAATESALMTFGPEYGAIGQQAARIADEIFQGANPSDLPIEIPEFLLTINLRTAEAIGLEIPDDIIQQADIVIR